MSRKKIPIEEFFPAYMEAVKNEETIQAFSERLGAKPATVQGRIRDLQKQGIAIPMLRSEGGGGGRVTVVDKVREMMAAMGVQAVLEQPLVKKGRAKKPERLVKEPEPEPDTDDSEDALKEIFG